jgi:DNA-directed RNA polymerase subunit beta
MLPRAVDFMDVSPKQLVSVAAALIPFLENDDANRALMGSNMQRQAVPLVRAEAPLVGTGMERSWRAIPAPPIAARRAGVVDQVDATRIVIRATEETRSGEVGRRHLPLMKFQRSNQNTCINQRPLVKVGDVRSKGRHHRRRPVDRSRRAGARPQRARRLHAVERLQLRGLDPALRAHRADDVFTSIHIEEFEVMARDTKLGPEEITRDIPNVGERR